MCHRKNKSFRPKDRGNKGLKNLQSVKTLAGRIQVQGSISSKARKQPLTVTAQFQMSLNSLMDTLNQANPFFIRCIKSNSNKVSFKKIIFFVYLKLFFMCRLQICLIMIQFKGNYVIQEC